MTKPRLSVPDDFAALAALVAPGRYDRDDSSPPTYGDWRHMLALAERHRVIPALADAVRARRMAVPEPFGAVLRAGETGAVFDEMAQMATLAEIVGALETDGIAVTVLKGVPLSLAIHGRLGMRMSRDIDLLVAPRDVAQACSRLAAMGFVPRQPLDTDPACLRRLMRRRKDVELLSDARRQIVELHWRLFDNRRLMPLPLGGVADRLTLPTGTDCSILPPGPNIAYLAVHGAQHGWSRLKWLCDIAGFVALLGPDGVAALYDAMPVREGRRALAQALILAHGLFGSPLPTSVARDHARDWRIRALVGIAARVMTAAGADELETIAFGSTRKNVSHYLLRTDPAYLLEELVFDLLYAAPDSAGRFPLGRLTEWLGRHFSARR